MSHPVRPFTGFIVAFLAALFAAPFARAQALLDGYSTNLLGSSYVQKSGSTSWNVLGGQLQAESGGGYSAFAWTGGQTLQNVGDAFSVNIWIPRVVGGQNGGLAVWATNAANSDPSVDRYFEPRLSYTGSGYTFTSEANNSDGYLITPLSGNPIDFTTLTVTLTDFVNGTATLTASLSGSGFATITQAYSFAASGGFYVGPSSWQGTGGNVIFDNLSYSTSAIPEPSTYAAIFGSAALGLAAWRRRRASRQTST